MTSTHAPCSIGPLTIRTALYEEANKLALLRGIAVEQKTGRKKNLDFGKATRGLNQTTEIYQDFLTRPHYATVVAQAPEFESEFPVVGYNHQQLAGFAVFDYTKEDVMEIGALYTVRSPYRTGSALMGFCILQAVKENSTSIQLNAINKKSADFYRNCVGFGRTKGGEHDYVLKNAQFGPALERLSTHSGLDFNL